MGQHGICLGDYFMWDWTECASAVLDDPFYQCQLDTIDWWSYLVQPYTYWFSAGWICPFPIEGWRSSSRLCLKKALLFLHFWKIISLPGTLGCFFFQHCKHFIPLSFCLPGFWWDVRYNYCSRSLKGKLCLLSDLFQIFFIVFHFAQDTPGGDFVLCILLGVLWDSWICSLMSVINFGKFSASFISNIYSASFFLLLSIFPSHVPHNFIWSPTSWMFCPFFSVSPRPPALCISVWQVTLLLPLFKLTVSPISVFGLLMTCPSFLLQCVWFPHFPLIHS